MDTIDVSGPGEEVDEHPGSKTCSNCGTENSEKRKFCQSCGNSLEPEVDSQLESTESPKANLAQKLKQWFPLSFGQTWKQRSCELAVATSGIIMLISGWLPWSSKSGYSLTGWQWYEIGRISITKSGNFGTPIFVYTESRPLFTGLFTMVVSIAILICVLLLFIYGNRKTAIVLTEITSLTLIVAIMNFVSLVTLESWSAGVGIILMLAFSVLAFAGSIASILTTPKEVAPD